MKFKLIIPSLFISAMAFSQTSVSGYVFEDINKNQKKKPGKRNRRSSSFQRCTGSFDR